ncbi:glycosyltransferase [Salegentibacter mishustinae]|uniref:glycosyltransferase family 2 protein n=1 Tax=Salegentibacter mishustinae TaxID=270918 RepID=UPI001CE159F0|nr:glycosyltransferase family 2 protein [Salegentibacter mishustinae]UBZ07455.1 glycosyltransferase [Salegentibacter mishustinae]
MNPLVSIIIPTYNRAHLIGETLESILAQTYTNWECIVVDDGSTDYTDELLEFYRKKDHRIQFHHRPPNRRKGANACRNYGYELSQGDYIQWFDSDDVMFINHLEALLSVLQICPYLDFVIGNSINFNEISETGRPYIIDYEIPINAENYINERIGWITNDVLLRKSSITVAFDERISAGQEYNFFSKLLSTGLKGQYVKKDLTLRRVHSNTIQENLKKDQKRLILYCYKNDYYILQEFKDKLPRNIIKRNLKRLIRFSYELSQPFTIKKIQWVTWSMIKKQRYIKIGGLYLLWIVANRFIGRGYLLLRTSYRILD